MADQKRKFETISSIEKMQLPQNLIAALDDASTAESIALAVQSLKGLTEQWN